MRNTGCHKVFLGGVFRRKEVENADSLLPQITTLCTLYAVKEISNLSSMLDLKSEVPVFCERDDRDRIPFLHYLKPSFYLSIHVRCCKEQ